MKEIVKPIRARAKESDQKKWQKMAKNEGNTHSQWVRDKLNS